MQISELFENLCVQIIINTIHKLGTVSWFGLIIGSYTSLLRQVERIDATQTD